MSLDSVLVRYGRRTVTPATAGVTPDVTPKPAWIGACTPVTAVTAENPTGWLELDRKPPPDPTDWHELAREYHAHHFNCQTCIAAGRGAQYGLRCGVGAALWRAYSD